jgi:hypothetical protein
MGTTNTHPWQFQQIVKTNQASVQTQKTSRNQSLKIIANYPEFHPKAPFYLTKTNVKK